VEKKNEPTETEKVRQGETRGVNKILVWSITGAAAVLAVITLLFVR